MLNVTCPRSALHEAVQIVSRGVTGRSTQPVQQNVMLVAENQQLRLIATDLETISVEAVIEATVEEEGRVTAPARLLNDVFGALPEAPVTLVADESQALSVSCVGTRETIRGLSAADFQTFPAPVDPARATVPQSQLYWVIRQTHFACSKDETRPILTGALVEFTPGAVQIVATDTYRLALRKIAVDHGIETPVTAIVSSRALSELLRVLSADVQEPVTISIAENLIQFEIGNLTVASRLIEGQFPNYQKVIPESAERKVGITIKDFEPALRRALIVAREDNSRVILRPRDNSIELAAESQDVGRFAETVPAEFEGEATEIAFNARYMLDVLEAVDAPRIRLEITGPLNPGMIRAEGNDDYLYVLMPMQIM